MSIQSKEPITTSIHVHSWLKQTRICYLPGKQTGPLVSAFARELLAAYQQLGNIIQDRPDNSTDVLLTTAPFDEPLSWRHSYMFTGRARFHLEKSPTVFTIIPATPGGFGAMLDHFERALEKPGTDPEDFRFEGLAPDSYATLIEQGKRGGPILALLRLLQARSKCIHILLLIGDSEPEKVLHFDLVGAYPESRATDRKAFYTDIALRMMTYVSTFEITEHEVEERSVPREVWDALRTPRQLFEAGRQLDARGFFTAMIEIDKLVHVPVISDSIAKQYSEGCFATWDTDLGALVATITGSARPVDKGQIGDDDLAIVSGIRADGRGAIVRHVEGKRNDPPSSESVELYGMDAALPKIGLRIDNRPVEVPAARSKLHGHRGIKAYDPQRVEFVRLDAPYYHFPVSCATAAQAAGIKAAFSRSEVLNNPDDPREVVFTVLPTHGVVIVERWVEGKNPLETIWEYFDAGYLVVENQIPQGEVRYEERDGKMHLSGYSV